MRVRCPKCSWRPDGRPHWMCDSCGAAFDTFATCARCPECTRTWSETQCIACNAWSLHEDWYLDSWPVAERVADEVTETADASDGGG